MLQRSNVERASQIMTVRDEPTDFAGAISLIRNCVGGKAGERLLIVCEPEINGVYDTRAPKLAAAAARAVGMTVYELESSSFVSNDDEKAILLDSLRGFDHIVFFSRVGDQIRFSSNDIMPSSTMCYTLDQESLNSNFGTACHHGMGEIKRLIESALENSTEIRVTCPLGTDYVGCPNWGAEPHTEVTLKRFPLLVPQPIPARGFRGRIALSRFLIGTGSRYYDPYYLPLPNNVFAFVEDNRIVSFEGSEEDVQRVENHYRHVSNQLSIDPWYVDSWHAGIHPGCNFKTDAATDMMRWSGSAFGNPRILHFHTCGQYAPGEICWNILDPTVTVDRIALWEAGTLHPERLPEGMSVLAQHPHLAELFANPVREIGLAG